MIVPKKSYFICATARSGSTLLSEGLGRSGLAGYTSEWMYMLRDRGPSDLRSIDNGPEYVAAFLARENLQLPSEAFLARYLELCTDGNGVFGAKMFWRDLKALEKTLRPAYGEQTAPIGALLNRLLPNLQYVYLEREDVARQAISVVIARQTNSWNSRKAAERAPAFDFDAIYHVRSNLLKRAEQWNTFFEENGIEPLRLTYERVAADYEGALASVLGFLGIAVPAGFKFGQPEIGVQGTSLNREWAERFAAELEARGLFADSGPGSQATRSRR